MRDRFALATSILLTLVVSLSATRSVQAIDQVIRKSSATPVRGKITAISKTGLTVKPQVAQLLADGVKQPDALAFSTAVLETLNAMPGCLDGWALDKATKAIVTHVRTF